MLPNTFVIGAMKSATTSLCNLLSQHPNVFVPRIKEPDFYSRDEVFSKGFQWYESMFNVGSQHQVVIDGSTSYAKQLQFPRASKRLAEHRPDAKIIYILRHPIDRLCSHWKHEVLKNRTRLNLNDFIIQQPEAIDISCYWKQISLYRDQFPKEQILVLFTQEFHEQPIQILDECCRFLKLPKHDFITSQQTANRSDSRRPDAWPVRIFRKYRWFDTRFERLKQSIPESWHPALKTVFKSKRHVSGDERLSDSIRQWAEGEIVEDAKKILIEFNRPLDYWTFQFTPTGP
ncbi:MAG: sulfotransferase [Planctomycetota bacterium]